MPISDDAFRERARRLRLLIFDVDGVLTNGTIDLQADGSESKQFFVRDGSALKWAQNEGLNVGFISGRMSPALTMRAKELGISMVIQGEANKPAAFERLLAANGISSGEAAFMGDDLPDIAVLMRAGLSAAPSDATDDVRSRVHWISRYPGGRGAVREFIEMVLRARGRWDAVVEAHLTS